MITDKKYYDTNVVITGADHPTGLGTGRALIGKDINLIGICSNKNSPCCRSRVWGKIIAIPINDKNFLKELINICAKRTDKVILFPCQDNFVQIISDNRELLEKYYTFVLPDKSSLNMLLDKIAFHEWAKKQGFTVPEAYFAESYQELEFVLNKVKYPVILKPYIKTDTWDLVSPHDKVLKIRNKRDIENINFDIFQATSKLIIQQWIPGRDSDVYFCLEYFDRDGRELAYYTGRKIFQWPVGSGSTAAAIGFENHEIHKTSVKVFKKAELRGIGSLEFKQSEKDKKFYIIEPTVGRNDLQSFVSVAGGTNITKIALHDAIGDLKKNVSVKKQKGVWIAEEGLINALRYLWKAKLFKVSELFTLTNGKRSYSLFDIKDPMPFIDFSIQKVKRKIFS
jgi:predicted ATP-grasp superfamily ATP-dependent carboligase